MKHRLTEEDRIKLEARYEALRDVTLMRQAYLEPGKVSGLADKIGPDQAEISGFVEALMKLMDAEPEVSKYKKANKTKLYNLLKKAMDMAPNPDAGENPEEEAMHLKDPAMHMVEDLEHEVQTLDDATLSQLVEKLEERMKSDLAKMPGASPVGATSNAPMVPPAKPAPKPEAPKPSMAEKSEPSEQKASFPPKKESPESEESDDDSSNDEEKEDKPEMKSEARLALLMSLPKEKRLAKAAQLKALAGVLEGDTREVSQDNEINDVNGSDPSLTKDYEPEEEGSMKDVKAAQLIQTARQLLAALEDSEEKDEEDDEKDATNKEAVLSLALRHLVASVEDMQEAKKDSDDEDDSEDKMEKEASEDSKPEWLEDAEKKAEEKEDEEPSKEEKTAILKAKLANLKRTTRIATVDGKTMNTPKEVPSPSGTTEDNLKGDAKIQYSTNNGEDGLDVINDRRTPVKKDKSVAGTDEPNELYFSNNPTKDRYEPTSESDSSKDVNNKRVLKDMGEAVQKSQPSSPTDHMEMGSGSHQKEKSWDKAKSESDTTPSGDRLVGLAEMIEQRTERAIKLAGKMAELGLISTGSQLTEKIIELAKMEDKEFTVVSSFLSNNLSKSAPSKSRTAGEMPPWLDKGKEKDESDDSEDDDSEDDDMPKKEAGSVRRVARMEDTEDEVSAIRRATKQRGGLKTALLSGTSDLDSPSVRGSNSYIGKAISKIAWTNPLTEAQQKSDLDDLFRGPGR